MAKFSIGDDDLQQMVSKVANETGLAQMGIDFLALTVTKAKDVVQVVKASNQTEVVAKRSDLVCVIIYTDAWDSVDEKTQLMWLRMEMSKVAYDGEKDKIVIGCPQFTVPVFFYEKYKDDAINAAVLAQYTIAQIEDKKKQEAAEKKSKKKKSLE